MRFPAVLELHGRTATGFEVPPEVVGALGGGGRPAVRVTLHRPGRPPHTWRSSAASMGGRHLVGVSAAERTAAGVTAGDVLDVELELDTAPREVEVPPDLRSALDADPAVAAAFASLSYSLQRRHVLAVEGARTEATRARRVEGVLTTLRQA